MYDICLNVPFHSLTYPTAFKILLCNKTNFIFPLFWKMSTLKNQSCFCSSNSSSSQLQTKILKIGAWIRLTVIITRRTDRTSKCNLCTEKIRLSMVSKYGNNLGSYITQREPGAALLVRDEKKATIRAAALHNMYEM